MVITSVTSKLTKINGLNSTIPSLWVSVRIISKVNALGESSTTSLMITSGTNQVKPPKALTFCSMIDKAKLKSKLSSSQSSKRVSSWKNTLFLKSLKSYQHNIKLSTIKKSNPHNLFRNKSLKTMKTSMKNNLWN